MYHPAYALRNPSVERESFDDMARIPGVLVDARERRRGGSTTAAPAPTATAPTPTPPDLVGDPPATDTDQLSLF